MKVERKICPQCNTANSVNSQHCITCGASLATVQPVQVDEFQPEPSLRERMVIKNPFWAGFVMGIGASLLGGMTATALALLAWAASSPYSGDYRQIGGCGGLLIGSVIIVGLVAYGRKRRAQEGYPQASGSGIACGIFIYLVLNVVAIFLLAPKLFA